MKPVSNAPPVAQGAEVSYALQTLGWKAFQDLCGTILSELWGQTYQIFAAGHDGGRDGGFRGTWQPGPNDCFKGSFTVQCKFTTRADQGLTLASLGPELEKAKKLAAEGLADNYFLMSNCKLTAVSERKIKRAFEGLPGLERCQAYGAPWISEKIRQSDRLRMLVPRVYGLGDLSQILDERAYRQAHEILSVLQDDLSKFVITDAYRRSQKALVQHGFVILLGEPACGKSTIASALALAAADCWGCRTVKIRDVDEIVRHWNPNEPNQFFWFDDAFGATQLDPTQATKWNQVWGHLQAAIRRGARMVVTSRTYIYELARSYIKEHSFPLFRESQIVIQVEHLKQSEKEQILYNHVRGGNQPKTFRQKVKPFLQHVSAHPGFLPEIARRLGEPLFTKSIDFSMDSIVNFVARPVDLLMDTIRTLESSSRAALALIFMRGGQLRSPICTTKDEDRAIELLGGTLAGVRQALNCLLGSFVLLVAEGSAHYWRFKHPTMRDAFSSLVAQDCELLDIYLKGTQIDSLLSEVACGVTDVRGVKVIVPRERYPGVLQRLRELETQSESPRDVRNRFLAHRCDRNFLTAFLEENPGFVEALPVRGYLAAASETSLFVKLHQFGLLPEDQRVRFVTEAAQMSIESLDAGILRKDIRALFTPLELQQTLEAVCSNLDNAIEQLSDPSCDEHGFMDFLRGEILSFQREFGEDSEEYDLFESVIQTIDNCWSPQDYPDYDGGYSMPPEHESVSPVSCPRSIFDDVDE